MRAGAAGIPAASCSTLSRARPSIFANGDAAARATTAQTPEDYVRAGLGHHRACRIVLVRRNMAKIARRAGGDATRAHGLTRGLDLRVLDRGRGEARRPRVSFNPRADALGVVLPSNSPGVHSLWAPAIALKTPWS